MGGEIFNSFTAVHRPRYHLKFGGFGGSLSCTSYRPTSNLLLLEGSRANPARRLAKQRLDLALDDSALACRKPVRLASHGARESYRHSIGDVWLRLAFEKEK